MDLLCWEDSRFIHFTTHINNEVSAASYGFTSQVLSSCVSRKRCYSNTWPAVSCHSDALLWQEVGGLETWLLWRYLQHSRCRLCHYHWSVYGVLFILKIILFGQCNYCFTSCFPDDQCVFNAFVKIWERVDIGVLRNFNWGISMRILNLENDLANSWEDCNIESN